MLTQNEILQMLHAKKNKAEADMKETNNKLIKAKQKTIRGNATNWDLINAKEDRARLNAEIDLLRDLIFKINS